MAINSRQQLADFALRQLGGGINNIEITPEQIEDNIALAIEHYQEYHFDGIVRDYLVHKISGTKLFLDDTTGFKVGTKVSAMDNKTFAEIVEVSTNTITINRQIGYEKFVINKEVKNSELSSTTFIREIVLGDVDNGWIEAGENIIGVIRILNITSVLGSSDYMFNMQYQIMMTELQALTKAGASMYWQTLNYLGHLDFILKKEKNFSFNRRMNRLMLEIAWGTDVRVGDIVAAEVYHTIDEEKYTEVYNDIWLKNYVTALFKKQWGTNLKKYKGMQLPGGLVYDGQTTYDEAVQEIKNLQDDAIISSAPLSFFIG